MKLRLTFFAIALLYTINGFSQGKSLYDYFLTRYQHYYNEGRFDSVYYIMSDRIHSLMPEAKCIEMLTALRKETGFLNGFEYSHHENTMGIYTLSFEKKKLMLKIMVDEHKKINIFNFMPYIADTSGKK
ncbi:MAG: DUF3887 domain-containing protein [Chitinophagia bacterium]|nr:DUF3887 domain-containing protein [Chitinophagia bacterium]